MFKRVCALIVLFCILFSPVPEVFAAPGGPEAAEAAGLVYNSDVECGFAGCCWYVDTMGAGCLMAARIEAPAAGSGAECSPEIRQLTDYPVDQVLYREGILMVSAGHELLCLDPESGEKLALRSFDQPILRFAVCGETVYLLVGTEILRLEGEEQSLVLRGAERFWLEGPDELCYLRDETEIHSLRLSDGSETVTPNCITDLGDVPVARADSARRGATVTTMRQKFPHGKYWNHMPFRGCGMKYNNQDGWTDIPCPKHNDYCGTSNQTCNGYAPDGKELSYQCWGYADKLGYDVSGRDPQKEGSGWKKLWTTSALKSLKAGDIIRFNRYGDPKLAHSLYVTAVNGDTITYTDCNYNGTCIIRWGQTVSKSTIRSQFVFLLSAPAPAAVGGEEGGAQDSWLVSLAPSLDGTPLSSAKELVCFDVWLDDKAYKTGVSAFEEALPQGSRVELRNLVCKTGFFCDEENSELLIEELSDHAVMTLDLNHYYLNSKKEKVKTKLTDLPEPGKWPYKQLCWALENGVSDGLSETRFAANEPCPRAQAMAFLWATQGRPKPKNKPFPFSDVTESDWYYEAVRWAVGRRVTAGKSAACFAPEDTCTRAEVLTFVWSLAGRPRLPGPGEEGADPELEWKFKDVKKTDWFYHPVLWGVSNKITTGTTVTSFSPKKTCTRAEILTFLWAAAKLRQN